MTKIKITDIPLGAIENENNKTKKLKAASKIKLFIPLKEIPSEYWDKVKVGNDWDREYIESTNTNGAISGGGGKRKWTFRSSGAKKIPMMESSNDQQLWDRRFRNQADLDNFHRYIADDDKERIMPIAGTRGQRGGKLAIKDFTTSIWIYIPKPDEFTKYLKNANKLFINGGHGKTTSQEAFKFLQSIIESKEIISKVKFIPGDEFTLGEWLKYRNKFNNNDQIELTAQEAIELGISTQQPSPSQPVVTPQPILPPSDNNNSKLPNDLPNDWRDKLARIPYLEKANQDLEKEKNRIEKETKIKINLLNSDLQSKEAIKNDLEKDLSALQAKFDHLKNHELKMVQQRLAKWESTFKGQEAYEVERELNKPKLTPEQQDKLNNHDKIQAELKEWQGKFSGKSPESARTEYEEALRNQKPVNHDKISEDLREYQLAFPAHKFPKRPEEIRKEYDKLFANQKPTDYEQIKSDLEKWVNVFSDPAFQGKTPSQIKDTIEEYKDKINELKEDLLNKHREDINRLVNNTVSWLKHVRKESITNKYGKTVDQVAESGLTLENTLSCIQNLNAVMAICATEKAVEWNKQIDGMSTNDDNRDTQVIEIMDFLPKVETLWKRVPISAEKNNPFYLPEIENKTTHSTQISDLVTKWGIQKRILLGEEYVALIEQPTK